jgi:RHS repeat-associated protein
MNILYRPVCVLFLLLAGSVVGSAQVTTGTPPFASFSGGRDAINLGNLNVHLDVPVLNKTGRGMPFTYDLANDSSVWVPITTSGATIWNPVFNWGWVAQTQIKTGYIRYFRVSANCDAPKPPFPQIITYSNFIYYDAFGGSHRFSGEMVYDATNCLNGTTGTLNSLATDGSGLTLSASLNGAGNVLLHNIITKDGQITNPPLNLTTGYSGTSATATDRNGNQISVNSASNSATYTDTLGLTALTVTGTATSASPLALSYTAPSGATASYTVSFKTYTVETNFGCSGVAEYGPLSNSLVDRITLPDGTFYQFNYEPTPGFSGDVTGRLASVTLPTLGTISYTYTGGSSGHITCTDGSASGFTRQTPDGSWTYSRTAGTGAAYTTAVTDPQGNMTQIQFQGIYETQRQVNQGASTLLQTTNTCYNTAVSPCTATAVTLPISQVDVYVQPAGASNLIAKHTTKYNAAFGMVTEQDDFDYGPGAPGPLLQKTAISYASLGNNIVAFPQQVTMTNGAGTKISQTNNNYDETAVIGTSGTPQHTSVTGSRGNLTSVNSYANGTTFLTSRSTYFDTGTRQTVTDVNGVQTTNVYGPTTSCGNSFPTSITEPLSLSRSMTWNCTGGVLTSATDDNGKTTTISYVSAFFWRPGSVQDPAGATNTFHYNQQSSAESVMSFNSGASAVDVLTTFDSLGRTHLQQTRESPASANYDTIETDYDSLGRPNRISLPFVSSVGAGSSTAPGAFSVYDALNRVTQVTDSGGGTTTTSYSQNDALVTVGPAPAGENTKRRQLQYDSLGRLTSVCEMTSATGSGTCGQTTAQTGYWAKYAYNASGSSLTVTQNAQAAAASQQTRSYVFDLLGRLNTETNPENGTRNYTFDTDSSCGTSSGDLVKRVDNAGNTTCFAYDAIHRLLSKTYSGPDAARTLNKYFVYDAATVDGAAMINAKSRLAEAYTSTCATCAKTTDLGFGYSARGEVSDQYQTSPNSAGFYHENLLFWENGATLRRNGLSIPQVISYAPDGEGRISTVSLSNFPSEVNQNPVTSTTFNAASLPTAVTIGSGDSDAFTYDPNTLRETKYQFTVNGQSYSGVPTWNANGSLNGLNITDPFNSADTQTCSYQHDDLSRIANVNCSPNQLVNPGFEGGNVDWSYNSGWSIVNNPANAQSGSWYLSGTSSSDSWAIATIGGSLYQPVTPGQVVQYGGWIRRISGTGNMWYSCEVVDTNHNFVAWCPFGAGIGDGTGGTTWQFYQQEFTIPAGGAYAVFHTEIHGAGDPDTSVTTGYFDAAFFGAPSTWTQVFGYDPFGNITKTVPSGGTGNSFQATYSPSTNHITNIAGFTPTYDANGNVLNDGLNTYTWDAEGKPASVNGTARINDAFNRAVEAGVAFFYSADNSATVAFQGQNAAEGRYKLPGGIIAIFDITNTGLKEYLHPDHLGSLRFGSTVSRTYAYSLAYAPFGELYARSTPNRAGFFAGLHPASFDLYDSPAREYSDQGRWATPDPAGLAAVNSANPQSLNRYAYVKNNPLSRIDPSGLVDCNNGHYGCGNCQPQDGCSSDFYGSGNPGNGCADGYASCGGGGVGTITGVPNSPLWNTNELNTGEARYQSIVNTGWDPALGIQYYSYSFTGGNGSILERQMELAAIQFGQQACAGQVASAVGGCIQQVYNQLADAGASALQGGNYDFSYADQSGNLLIQINGQYVNPSDFGCPASRCGTFDSLDYSHGNGTFHVDTANPLFFPVGTVVHTVVDVVGGNTWWSGGIPRFP